jgi:hypothetical protein
VRPPRGTFFIFKLPNRWSYTERLSRALGTYYHGKHSNDRVYTPRSATALLERHGFNVEDVRRANMLPLNISGHLLRNRGTNVIWGLNRFLSAIPVVNTIATNVDVVARVGSSDPNDQRESGTRIVRWS